MWHNQTIEQVLVRHLGSEDEALGDALGILTGTLRADFSGIGRVEIKLTDEERAELLSAIIKSQRSWLRFPVAHYMSLDLESLVCGHKPERYKIIGAEAH